MKHRILFEKFATAALMAVYIFATAPVFAVNHTITGSNFSMYDPGGELVATDGANDVTGNFDDSLICNAVSCTDISMTLSSNTPFFGNLWTARSIRTFSQGSYVFDTNCTEADIAAGTTDCGGGASLNLTVGPGQLGAHMLFDWGSSSATSPCGVTNCDIDVAIVWDQDDSFDFPIYDGGTGTPDPSTVFNLVSRDGDANGAPGIAMVDGPFIGFEANFNLFLDPPDIDLPPFANDDVANVLVDTPTAIDVVANDTDVEDGSPPPVPPAAVNLLSGSTANGGSVSDNGDGTVLYTPPAGFLGDDTFQYTLSDSGGSTSNIATVTVTVTATLNNPPVANDLNVVTDEDTSLVIDPTTNDSDPDSDPLTVIAFDAASAQGGTVVDNGGNTLLYTPASNFNGADSFSYTISDGRGGTDSATVFITVNPVNDAVVCTDVTLSTDVDTPLDIDVATDLLSTCSDSDNDPITLVSTTQPTEPGSTLSDDGAGTLTYTPASGFSGQDSFTYTATDGVEQDTRTVLIDVGKIFGNFTMLDGDGVTFGGTNDIVFSWDGTCYNSVAEADAGPINMTMGSDSNFPFFGFPWSAHDIKVYCPGGPYVIDSCNAGVTPPDCGPLSMTVPDGHLGGHILFDWNVTEDIDVAIVWNNSTGGTWDNVVAGGQLYQGPTGPTPALDEFYEWISVDADGDGVPGIQFVDGPFINFRANFNFKTTRSDGGEVEIPRSTVPSPNLGSATSGCSIVEGPSATLLRHSDWLVVGIFMVWWGIATGRRRQKK